MATLSNAAVGLLRFHCAPAGFSGAPVGTGQTQFDILLDPRREAAQRYCAPSSLSVWGIFPLLSARYALLSTVGELLGALRGEARGCALFRF